MPSWKDLDRFLNHDGWFYDTNRSGKDKFYIKRTLTGDWKFMRVSKGSGEISKKVFPKILKEMGCSKTYFNAVLANSKKRSEDPAKRMI